MPTSRDSFEYSPHPKMRRLRLLLKLEFINNVDFLSHLEAILLNQLLVLPSNKHFQQENTSETNMYTHFTSL